MFDFNIGILYSILLIIAVSFAFALILVNQIKKRKIKNPDVKHISSAIREGARAFLNKEYKAVILFVIIAGCLLFMKDYRMGLAFLTGALFSALSGNIGMKIATLSNGRVAEALKDGVKPGLNIAFNSGSVMGIVVSGLGLLGIVVLYLLFRDPQLIYGFGFGASSVALFARVGGGIYTKAADVGADIVGKVEAGIPEDDPRNPAVIADNVGDNVGDVAGMGADLFESYVDSIIVAMVLGASLVSTGLINYVMTPLLIAGIGLLSSLIGIILINVLSRDDAQKVFNLGTIITAAVSIGLVFALDYFVVHSEFKVSSVYLIGLFAGLGIGYWSQYYTSSDYIPTRRIAEESQTGGATNIIAGLATGMKSTSGPIIMISIAILLAYKLLGIYGIAVSGVGMLSILALTLAVDCYGPVADNAAGIAEMAHLGPEIRERAEKLDAVGNTTAAVGKGFAIGSAALTSLALLMGYLCMAHIKILDLTNPYVFTGIFIGGLLPFLFSSLVMEAVGRAATKIIEEVRRQFTEIKGLREGKAKAEYGKCVEIVTSGALREMILPAVLAIITPIIIGFIFGKEALGGLLVGSITTGFLLAVMMANSGGAWDNAKKYIESGKLGGKGSATHKAAVIGDTVGDPFKDTAGPSLNILIKLISIVAILIAPLL